MLKISKKKSGLNKKIFYILSSVAMFCVGLAIPLGLIFFAPSQPINSTNLEIKQGQENPNEENEEEETNPSESEILSINNGKVTYIGKEKPTQILIPEVVKEETVTKIDGSSLPSTLETLILPNTITEINPGEFAELDRLKNIIVENSQYGTQDGAIYKKDESGNLTILVSVPAGKTGQIIYASTLSVIGERAFENTNLDTITIPSGTTTISAYAFNKTKYEKIVLPSTITSLSANAFAGMVNLSEIVLNSSISAYTLPEITFTGGTFAWYKDGTTPTQVTTMLTSGAYYVGRSALAELSDGWTIAMIGNKYYVTGVPEPGLYPTDKLSIPSTIGGYTITGVGNGTTPITNIGAYRNIELKSGIVSVSAYAFSGKINDKIVIPSTVTSIGAHAFEHCGMKTIDISSVTSLGEYAFCWGYELTSVTLSPNLTVIPEGLFEVCRKLTTVNNFNSNNNITSIGAYAFSSCNSLTSLSIPNSVRYLGKSAFSGITSLISITIPSGVTAIPDCLFRDSGSLTSITLPNTITTIGFDAFIGTKISSITLPTSLTTIGKSAFMGVPITSISIPASVSSIGDGAFGGCNKLATVTFQAGSQLTTINASLFSNCTSQTALDLPATIKHFAFGFEFINCTSLKTLTVRSTTFVQAFMYTFEGVTGLTVKVPSALVDSYKSAPIWKNFNIVAI